MTTYTELKQQILDYCETDAAVVTDVIINDIIAHAEDRIFRTVELDCFKEYVNGNTAAIRYRDRPYSYKSAIINTQEEHMVRNNDKERILFKISIFDKSYEEICNQFSSRFM